ncbi:MAG: hypothetical protein A3I02_16830 [Betaproteobacteria bacterium RIFCSPLOWO2_02_FULL_67_26]|nr:MAG: hypothetical protein A3I02_16830 [Betaproteobacteria bacterium RIFCSPLOWO2_02_FULL_67_26]
MNRRQFLYLVIALVVLGGAGLALVWQDIADYRASGARIGAKLLPDFRIADVAEVRLQNAKHQATLARKEKTWVVQERNGYPASFQEISDLMIKLAELKVTQAEQVGAALWPRIELADPGKEPGSGTRVEFKDGSGKVLASLILGKKVLKKDPLNPLPAAKDGVPAGRYVRVASAKDVVVVVSDPLGKAEADPGKWLNKDFFKADRVKTLAVGPEGGAPHWKIARAEEWGQWKFAAGGGNLDPSAAVAAANKLGSLAFDDVAADPKAESGEKPLVVVAETFDNLVYTVKLAKRAADNSYLASFTVAGEPPAQRVPEKDEKADQKERRAKEFEESRKTLVERVAAERALAQWTYVIAKSELDPLLRSRSDMVARQREGKPPPGFR